jgi:hypothetical protein
MSNAARTRRPAAHNPCIWVRRSKAEIAAAAARLAATEEHEHAYFQHPTIATHVGCACGWICRRDLAPTDLVFVGPLRVKGAQ